MIEPEIAFADLADVMDNAEAYVKYVVRVARERCPGDFAFFAEMVDKELPARLDVLVNEPFERVPYAAAVGLLQAEIARDPSKWEFPLVEFGTDLASEHERWLTEVHFGKPVFVYNYPREIKSFYMRDNEDGAGERARAAPAPSPRSDPPRSRAPRSMAPLAWVPQARRSPRPTCSCPGSAS